MLPNYLFKISNLLNCLVIYIGGWKRFALTIHMNPCVSVNLAYEEN